MAYSGWANRATWNVVLWLRNDEGLYNAMRQFVWDIASAKRSFSKRVTARDAELFARDVFPSGETPDGDNLVDVRWGEVARAMWQDR